MAAVDVRTSDGSNDGAVELADAWFAAEISVPAMHQVVTAQLAAARRGTSKVLSRSEVRGGGRKPWRQKGTGRARQGSIRAPQWAGGGVAHGPSGEQNHTKRVNRKLKRRALASALSDRSASGDVVVLRELAFDAPRTADAVGVLRALELEGRKVLLVLAGRDEVVWKSFRNLPDVHLLTADQLNVYDVLCSDTVVFVADALARFDDAEGTAVEDAAATDETPAPDAVAEESDAATADDAGSGTAAPAGEDEA